MTLRKLFILTIICAAGNTTLFAQSPQPVLAVASLYHNPAEPTFVSATKDALAAIPAASFTFHHRDKTVLLHLTAANNQVLLRVVNALGDCVHTLKKENLPQGFYEFPLLQGSKSSSGIYAIKLAVNGRLAAFQAVL